MTDIRPIVVKERRLRFETLSEREAFTLFDAALAALETRGVRVGSAAALDVLERAGAAVDRAAGVAKLSAGLVRGALDRAPASFTLAGRVARARRDALERRAAARRRGRRALGARRRRR